jgi:choline-sulfatase
MLNFLSMRASFIIIIGLLIIAIVIGSNIYTKEKSKGLVLCPDCNTILITMTNLRYDHMSFNGYFRQTTPNLDRLAEESIVFDNAFSHSSWTLPESISIYTSLYPFQHGVMSRHDGSKVSGNTITLTDVLAKNGYKTAAFTGGFDYNSQFGLTDRFDIHDSCAEITGDVLLPGIRRIGGDIYGELNCSVSKAIKWINDNKDQKFFVHVQGYDAHCPFSQRGGEIYDPDYANSKQIDFTNCLWNIEKEEPEIIDGKKYYSVYSSTLSNDERVLLGEEDIHHLTALYDESIFYADKEIGKLLNKLKELSLMGKTLIVFTSEHGDMLGENGRFMRGGQLRGTFYDYVLRVPLIIYNPKFNSHKIDGLASHIDLAPTITSILGIKGLKAEGKNLTPLMLSGEDVNQQVFSGSEFKAIAENPFFNKNSYVASVRDKKWKLIKEVVIDEENDFEINIELYNLAYNKKESVNLIGKETEIGFQYESTLNAFLSKMNLGSMP